MKYIEAQLLNGEEIVREIPISRRAVFAEAFLMTLPFIFVLFIIFMTRANLGNAAQQSGGAVINTIIVGLVVGLAIKIVTGRSLVELAFTAVFGFVLIPFFILFGLFGQERALTNSRLIHKMGIIRTDYWDATIERIQKATFNQTLLGKMFNFGTVSVIDALDKEHTIKMVDSPADITKLLNSVAGRRSFTQSPSEEVLSPNAKPTLPPQLDGEAMVIGQIMGGDAVLQDQQQ